MITSFYAGALSLIYVKISLETIKARRKHQISLGPGKNNEIEPFTSAHDNFAAYTCLLLILLYFLENTGLFPHGVIHLLGTIITVGRGLHFLGLISKPMNFKLRKWGMYLTLWPLLGMGILNIFTYFYLLYRA
jgi:uncharacterized membrane protein YecN with MAPEG domain